MSAADRALLSGWFDAACARVDAGALAAKAALSTDAIPTGARVFALGKAAHRQMSAVLAARPDLLPEFSIGTTSGPEHWARAGEHPLPGEASFLAGELLRDAAEAADGENLVLLLSGGGSSLAEIAAPGIPEDDLVATHRLLLGAGLDIGAQNVVRRRLSALKGGGLARAAPNAKWRVFGLSDVPTDDPAALASGPCVDVRESPGLARHVCRQAGLWNRLPRAVRVHLDAPHLAVVAPFPNVTWTWLGGARDLARAAAAIATEAFPDAPVTVLSPVVDPVDVVAQRYARWAADRAGGGPAILVAAGEPTLTVRGEGSGGRAQHLALLVARSIAGLDATFLAAGSDGRDGATSHAGAVVDGALDDDTLDDALRRFDSATFTARAGIALPAFEPVTHVGELHLLIVR